MHEGHAFPVVIVVVVVIHSTVPSGSISLKKTQYILQSLPIVAIGGVWIQMPICQGGFYFTIPILISLLDEKNDKVLLARYLLNIRLENLSIIRTHIPNCHF